MLATASAPGKVSRSKTSNAMLPWMIALGTVVVLTVGVIWRFEVLQRQTTPQTIAHGSGRRNAAHRADPVRTREQMMADWTARCKRDRSAFHIDTRSGSLSIEKSEKATAFDRCQRQPLGADGRRLRSLVANASSTSVECPFLMSVYDPEARGKHREFFQPDKASIAIRDTGAWLRRETALVQDLPSDSLIVDVGARLGWHTLVALSLGHRVIAFEPLPANKALLSHSLCLNHGLDERLSLQEVAVSEQNACTIASAQDEASLGILVCGAEQERAVRSGEGSAALAEVWKADSEERVPVQTSRLDSLLDDLDEQIDLLRIDCFGHELSVVRSGGDLFHVRRGGSSAAARLPPAYILSNFSPRHMALLGYQPIEYLDFFANRGYQVAIVNKNLEGIYTAASGSPKAHHVIKRNEFDTLIKEVWDTSVTLEMSLLDHISD